MSKFNKMSQILFKISNNFIRNKTAVWKNSSDYKPFEKDMYLYVNKIKENYSMIKDIILSVDNSHLNSIYNILEFNKNGGDKKYNSDKKWDILIIKGGIWIPESLSICPIKNLVESNYIHTVAISFLKPGTHIKPHVDPSKLVVRILVIIKTPENSCWIKVNNQKHFFKEGDILVFDASNIHEVKNEGNTERVALWIDFQRLTSSKILNKIIDLSLKKFKDHKTVKYIRKKTVESLKI